MVWFSDEHQPYMKGIYYRGFWNSSYLIESSLGAEACDSLFKVDYFLEQF